MAGIINVDAETEVMEVQTGELPVKAVEERKCSVCETLEGVRKWPKKKYYCKAHRPPTKKDQAAAKRVCQLCNTTDGVRKIPRGTAFYCKTHWPAKQAKAKTTHKCDKCDTFVGVQKWYGKNEWYCKKHRPLSARYLASLKQPCKECETLDGVKKWHGKDEWYCKLHWPPKKAKTYVDQPCKECKTLIGVRKWRGKDEWYCRKHWPAAAPKHRCDKCSAVGAKWPLKDEWYCKTHWPLSKKAEVKIEHCCKECSTFEGVRKRNGKDEWYCPKHRPKKVKPRCDECQTDVGVRKVKFEDHWHCKEHWPQIPASKTTPKKRADRSEGHICQNCGKGEQLEQIKETGGWYCTPCIDEALHLCRICGWPMEKIGRRSRHYICLRRRTGLHKDQQKNALLGLPVRLI